MEKSNLAKLISNYGSKLWSMISVIIFIPLYIKFLGNDNYGLISFYALILGLISFADSGLSSAIIKEFSLEKSSDYKYSVLKVLEKRYFLICLVISIIIIFFAPIIVDNWISSSQISRSDLVYFVRLIAIGVTSQLISSLYFGALFALNNQIRANLLQFCWSFVKSVFVILFFVFISKSLEIYLIWQIICNILYVLILRYFIIKRLKEEGRQLTLIQEFNNVPSHIKQYILGMVLIAIISAINIQADKLVTSSMFDLSTFGFYNIASSLAQVPVMFAAPILSFVFPVFSKIANSENENRIDLQKVIFNKVFFLTIIVVVVITVGILLYADEILKLWTKSAIPSNIFPAIVFDVKILIIGTFFLALQFPLFYYLLSIGKTKYTIYQGVAQILIGIPLLYFSSQRYGLYGIPFSWLFINLGAFVYLFIIVNSKHLNFALTRFYLEVLLLPIVITIIINSVFLFFYKSFNFSFLPYIIISGFLSLVVIILISNLINKRKVSSFNHLYNFPNE